MADEDRPSRKTYDRIRAMNLVLSGLEEEEGDAGKCPKCGGQLKGFRRSSEKKREGVVRCQSCGYFYVVRG